MKLTIISDKGSPMMVVQKISRKHDALEITGQLMGAWPAKMYITTEEFGNFLRAAFSPSVLLYVLLYPYFLISSKIRGKTIAQDP
jgi:hypothetical protein